MTTAAELSLDEILARQRAAFVADGFPSAATRSDRVARLQKMVLDNVDEIVAALTKDYGSRPAELTINADIAGSMVEVDEARRKVGTWMKAGTPGRILAKAGLEQEVRYYPRGVVGIIGPWNFPLNLVVVPAASAFAAGNRVMMRPSTVTRNLSELLARIAPQYFPVEELAVITREHGGGSDFSKLTFDSLFFTGSPEVGVSVAKAAAENLVPVTLELGGKNPVVVDVDADIERAAARVADSRLVNGGQVCLCPDYVYVPQEQVDRFVDVVLQRWREKNPSVQNNPEYTAIVNESNYRRIRGLIADAKTKGATVRQMIPAGESLPDDENRTIAPTVLTGVTPEMDIDNQEVFGPVLTVYPYRTLDDAITHIGAHDHPLTMYWYGEKNERFERLANATQSGSINGNDFALHMLTGQLPFGGVGRSGLGNYHGFYGFATFSHARAVAFSRMKFSFVDGITPPFTKSDKRGVRMQLKFWRMRNNRARRRSAK